MFDFQHSDHLLFLFIFEGKVLSTRLLSSAYYRVLEALIFVNAENLDGDLHVIDLGLSQF
jgi:hypothetical protein